MAQQSFNRLALQGNGVNDEEWIEDWNNNSLNRGRTIDPSLAYTKGLNDRMLEIVYEENIEDGVDEKVAMSNRKTAERALREMYAKRGLLKK